MRDSPRTGRCVEITDSICRRTGKAVDRFVRRHDTHEKASGHCLGCGWIEWKQEIARWKVDARKRRGFSLGSARSPVNGVRECLRRRAKAWHATRFLV